MKINIAYISDCGGKTINDDTVQILQERGVYVFVGDGLGGYAGGQMASQAASDTLISIAKQANLTSEKNLRKAVDAANNSVRNLQLKQHGNMKTTCVFLGIENGIARWGHVGDSRLYHFRHGRLQGQTKDHSVSQMAVMMGDITVSQIRFHEDRNRVLRALGAENTKPDISPELNIIPGDAFLLCTDGFWEFVYEEEMETMLQKTNDPTEWLYEMEKFLLKRVPSGTDNYSAAAVIIR